MGWTEPSNLFDIILVAVHSTLMTVLNSNFAAGAITTDWIAALESGEALPKSDLGSSAMSSTVRAWTARDAPIVTSMISSAAVRSWRFSRLAATCGPVPLMKRRV